MSDKVLKGTTKAKEGVYYLPTTDELILISDEKRTDYCDLECNLFVVWKYTFMSNEGTFYAVAISDKKCGEIYLGEL